MSRSPVRGKKTATANKGPRILQELTRLQEFNQKDRISSWKTRIHADADQQRLLIIRGLSERFVQTVHKELRERRDAGGSVVRKKGSDASSFRPMTAPNLPAKLSRQSSWLSLIPQRPSTSHDDVRLFKGLKDYDNMRVSERRQKFLQTISNAQNKNEVELTPLVNKQISHEARDSRAVFAALVEALPHAQKINLVHDALGPVRSKCTAFPEGVWMAPSKLRKTGTAIVLDPSINTKGKVVTLYVRYEDANAPPGGRSSSRSPSRSASPTNTTRAATPGGGAGAGGGMTARGGGGGGGGNSLNPTPRGRALSSRPRTSDATPRSDRGFGTGTGTGTGTGAGTGTGTGGGGGGGTYSPSVSVAGSRAGSVPSGGGKPGSSRGRSPSPSRSRSRSRPRKQVRVRELRLRGVGRFDLALASDATKYDNLAASASLADGAAEFGESYQYYDACLPGWDDMAPIFVPANVCVAYVKVEEDAFTALSRSRALLNSSSSGGGGARPSTSSSKAATLAAAAEPPGVTIVPMLTFPCRSLPHAAHLLSKFMSSTLLPRAANVTVKGGGLALQVASFHGNIHVVKQLLDSGANVNMRTLRFPRNTALHDAVLGGKEDVVRLLLQRGAKQGIVDEAGNTPLHVAALQANVPIARVLMGAEGAAAALVKLNGKKMLPVDLSGSAFMRSTLELGMRAHGIHSQRKAI